jgi:hypothetical protein
VTGTTGLGLRPDPDVDVADALGYESETPLPSEDNRQLTNYT